MKFDMHVHSSHSRDSKGSPKDLLKFAKGAGLDGIAITDHNAIEGTLEAYSVGPSIGILVVRGVEVSAEEGHVLAYGIREPVPRGLPVGETIERIHSMGGIAVASHPKRFPSGVGLEVARSRKFDAIEILNGGSSSGSNRKAARLAEEKRSPVTGGSDAHAVDQVGKAYTVLDGASTEDQVIDMIAKGLSRTGGRSRTAWEGVAYSLEVLFEWFKGDLKRL